MSSSIQKTGKFFNALARPATLLCALGGAAIGLPACGDMPDGEDLVKEVSASTLLGIGFSTGLNVDGAHLGIDPKIEANGPIVFMRQEMYMPLPPLNPSGASTLREVFAISNGNFPGGNELYFSMGRNTDLGVNVNDRYEVEVTPTTGNVQSNGFLKMTVFPSDKVSWLYDARSANPYVSICSDNASGKGSNICLFKAFKFAANEVLPHKYDAPKVIWTVSAAAGFNCANDMNAAGRAHNALIQLGTQIISLTPSGTQRAAIFPLAQPPTGPAPPGLNPSMCSLTVTSFPNAGQLWSNISTYANNIPHL